MTIKLGIPAIAIVLLTIGATAALAKGHDQGGTANPGENVQAETVAPAKTLGSVRGNSSNAPGHNKPQ